MKRFYRPAFLGMVLISAGFLFIILALLSMIVKLEYQAHMPVAWQPPPVTRFLRFLLDRVSNFSATSLIISSICLSSGVTSFLWLLWAMWDDDLFRVFTKEGIYLVIFIIGLLIGFLIGKI